jgi:hypothetical protein
MGKALWRLVAWVVTRPAVFAWLQKVSAPHPYDHIESADGRDVYMYRFWLFNPYGKKPNGRALPARWGRLPSIRLHHIMRADGDRDMHDHPWNARTILLRGWYVEERPSNMWDQGDGTKHYEGESLPREVHYRYAMGTNRLLFGQYHRITEVSTGGVWTLFFTWKYQGTWGFLVDGKKVSYREYLGLDK